MKRELAGIRQRLQSAIMRLEDIAPLYPSAGRACENIVATDLRPALETLEYLMEIADDA